MCDFKLQVFTHDVTITFCVCDVKPPKGVHKSHHMLGVIYA